MVSTVWSVSWLLFFYTRCPRTQPFVKVGGHVPPVPHGVGAPIHYTANFFTIFGLHVCLMDLINLAKLYRNRLMGLDFEMVEF